MAVMRARRLQSLVGLILGFVASSNTLTAASPPLGKQVRAQVDAILVELREDGDFEQADAVLQEVFDRVAAYAQIDDKDVFREAAFALRLTRQLKEVDEALRPDLLAFLSENGELAATLAFLVKAQHEKPAEIYALFDRLRRSRGEKLQRYANLTAAICVVHERPLKRRVNENTAQSVDPLEIFDYFVANEKYMFFPIRNVPAELLIYVVDTTATVGEMSWALRRYAGDPAVGRRFFDIKYDKEHFRKGAPKRVTVAGWNLPNILRYGGVCVDQAYFAMTVGKSIGVPTAFASGANSKVGHAWVGFLQAQGNQAWWNFEVGRYKAYQGVRGNVFDAQIRRRIPDSYVSLLADLARIRRSDRWAAAAYTDASMRLLELAEADGERAALGRVEEVDPARQANVESALELIEQALRISPEYAGGWMVIRDLARADKLTLAQKKRWAGVLHRLCGTRYPDFYLAILRPMIESLDEVREQNAFWNKAFDLFSGRHDLAASVRMSQAEMWKQAGAPAKAGLCYEDVIFRYANAGRFVIKALAEAEKLLRRAGRSDRVLLLYDRAFTSIKKPPDLSGPFYKRSNYYRVGKLYADRLEQEGLKREAAALRATIKAVISTS